MVETCMCISQQRTNNVHFANWTKPCFNLYISSFSWVQFSRCESNRLVFVVGFLKKTCSLAETVGINWDRGWLVWIIEGLCRNFDEFLFNVGVRFVLFRTPLPFGITSQRAMKIEMQLELQVVKVTSIC